MASFGDRGYLRQFASQCEAALAVARFDRCIGEVTDGAPCYADLLYLLILLIRATTSTC